MHRSVALTLGNRQALDAAPVLVRVFLDAVTSSISIIFFLPGKVVWRLRYLSIPPVLENSPSGLADPLIKFSS